MRIFQTGSAVPVCGWNIQENTLNKVYTKKKTKKIQNIESLSKMDVPDDDENIAEFFGTVEMMSEDECESLPKIREVSFEKPKHISDSVIKNEAFKIKNKLFGIIEGKFIIDTAGYTSNGAQLVLFENTSEARQTFEDAKDVYKKTKHRLDVGLQHEKRNGIMFVKNKKPLRGE